MKFSKISKYTQSNHYNINVSWDYLLDQLENWGDKRLSPVILNPDFQRGHVWTKKQQIAYVEYKLANGPEANIIYFNCVGWMDSFKGPFVCVDGLQRITAVLAFLNNEIKAYGHFCSDFEDQNYLRKIDFIFNVNNLKTREEVLIWYLEMNRQGTPHTKAELNKVKDLLNDEIKENNRG